MPILKTNKPIQNIMYLQGAKIGQDETFCPISYPKAKFLKGDPRYLSSKISILEIVRKGKAA